MHLKAKILPFIVSELLRGGISIVTVVAIHLSAYVCSDPLRSYVVMHHFHQQRVVPLQKFHILPSIPAILFPPD